MAGCTFLLSSNSFIRKAGWEPGCLSVLITGEKAGSNLEGEI